MTTKEIKRHVKIVKTLPLNKFIDALVLTEDHIVVDILIDNELSEALVTSGLRSLLDNYLNLDHNQMPHKCEVSVDVEDISSLPSWTKSSDEEEAEFLRYHGRTKRNKICANQFPSLVKKTRFVIERELFKVLTEKGLVDCLNEKAEYTSTRPAEDRTETVPAASAI